MSVQDSSGTSPWTMRRFAIGHAQTLAVWLTVYAAFRCLAPGGVWQIGLTWATVSWAAIAAGLLGSVTLAWRHWRRKRPDAAIGAYLGAATWPTVYLCVWVMTIS